VRLLISTKLGVMGEQDWSVPSLHRHIPKFSGLVNSLAALGLSEIWLKMHPPRYIVYSFVIYRAKATKFGSVMETMTRINPVNFVRIMQYILYFL